MSQIFKHLVEAGHPIGAVIGSDKDRIIAADLPNATLGAHIVTESGGQGFVSRLDKSGTQINMLTSEIPSVGERAAVYHPTMSIKPSNSLLGRVVDPLLHPLDGHPSPAPKHQEHIFADAPPFAERSILDAQLVTGVSVVDTLFPIVKGQRITIMGDAKSGKTSFTAQVAKEQAKNGQIVVFVLIAKRKTDVESLVAYLNEHKVLDKCVLVVASSTDALALSYIAPYSGCTIAEYFWHNGSDVVIIYDDLASHAKIYRELALLGESSPGREAYPGDMFYQHSSLLERAGKLQASGKTLTALPIMTTSNNDMTSYLATSLISITDGQLVFDSEEMQRGDVPPINTGLSVSRLGGRVQQPLHKSLAQDVFKTLGAYRQASEFAHFGQELPTQYQDALRIGGSIRDIFNQDRSVSYSLAEQQIMLKAVFQGGGRVNMKAVSRDIKKITKSAKTEDAYDAIVQKIITDYGAQSE